MKVIDDHIEKHLSFLLKDHSAGFDEILQYLDVTNKSEIQLLNYINKVLNYELDFKGSRLKFTHLHLPSFLPAMTTKILQFISVKFYFISFYEDDSCNENNGRCFFKHQLEILEKRLKINVSLGFKNYKKSENRQKAKKRAFRKLKKFYRELIDKDDRCHQVPIPRTLITTHKTYVEQFFDSNDEIQWAAKPVDSISLKLDNWDITETSYVILNGEKDYYKLDKIQIDNDIYLLEEIENVIVFNSDSKSANKKFNTTYLAHLNDEEQMRFKNLLIISFSSGPFRLNLDINRVSRILSNYFRRPDSKKFESYIIPQNEVYQLSKDKIDDPINVEMIGYESDYFDHFAELVGDNEGLKELISIKLRNLYSLCFNEKIKKLILRNLFEDAVSSRIVTDVTVSELNLLDSDSRFEILNALGDLLSVVIDIGLADRIKGESTDLCIIIPAQILDHKDFFTELRTVFGTGIKFTTWKNIEPTEKRRVIVLEYRDSGFHNFNIYPNLIETRFIKGTRPTGLFLSAFFNKNYSFNIYSYRQYFVETLLGHPFRKEFLKWDDLKEVVRSTKPEFGSPDHLWDLDNEYDGTSDPNSVIIEFEGNYCRTYYPSQLLVIKKQSELHLSILRAEDLLEIDNESDLMIQPLESLYENLNLFRVTEDEEVEIKKIKEDYGVPTGQGEARLWKELLKRKVNISSPDIVYNDLEYRAKGINSQMVSRNHFENDWLEPQSTSLIPRNKRMFKVICEYLELPNIYFRVMLKKRAREKQLSRISNSKMNKLFTQMIESGLFDDPPTESTTKLWKEIASVHDLEEIGINSENRDTELSALVDLARSNLKLEKLNSVQTKYT